MSITSYERLRIKHRSLLSQPPSEAALRDLLVELPGQLNDIVSNRPALAAEVGNSRQHVQQLQKRMRPGQLTNPENIAQGLHEALAPLFPSNPMSGKNSS